MNPGQGSICIDCVERLRKTYAPWRVLSGLIFGLLLVISGIVDRPTNPAEEKHCWASQQWYQGNMTMIAE